jgi:trehalose 6-phosphate synthase
MTRFSLDESTDALSDRRCDLVVVANRLPLRKVVGDDGRVVWMPSPGGLVTSMQPVIHGLGMSTAWIGWDGSADRAPDPPWTSDEMTAVSIAMTSAELSGFYDGFANGTLWPLYHDAIRRPAFEEITWHSYVAVNQRYANTAAEWAAPGGTVWIHDYHLQLVPAMLRAVRPDVRIGFFLHIPFPPPELFLQLPWRRQVLEGLLGADVIGFQEPAAVRNFGALVRRLDLVTGALPVLKHRGRRVKVGSYPVSIDAEIYDSGGRDPVVGQASTDLRERLHHPRKVLLGVDRLDYTKGIEARLEAFRTVLVEGSLTAQDITLVQVAVPSREDVGFYQHEREHIERLVSEINGQFGEVGAPVIHYLYRSVDEGELFALYQAADIALVTPYRDGMNLVAKEYVASRVHDDGVLILSEFAGAARELHHALLVNPFDSRGLVDALQTAISMPRREQTRRMRQLRKTVRGWSAADWAHAFLNDVLAGEL